MHLGITKKLAQKCLNTKYSNLNENIVNKIKYLILDSVGCILAGHVTERGRIAIDIINEFGGKENVTVYGAHKTSCAHAAFANSELMNSLDYDYIGPISGHIGPYVVPACLAIAEYKGSTGKDLILSLALANEVGGRSMSAFSQHKISIDYPPWYKEHPRFTYASSIFGAVVGTSKLLGADIETLENALGIAGASTPVPATMKWQHMSGSAIMCKYNAWTGWVSQLATVSSLMASKGFTGDRTILDGEYGYWNIIGSAGFDENKLLKELGEIWHIHDIKFKFYPTCYIYHAGIEGISTLVKRHNINPSEIEQIVVYGDQLMQTPNRMGTEVRTFADAQFFIKFNYALAVYYGNNPSAKWQSEEVYLQNNIQELSKRVYIETHPEFDEYINASVKKGIIPILWSSKVVISTKSKKYSIEIKYPKGCSENDLIFNDLLEKFLTNAKNSKINNKRLNIFIDSLLNLESIDNVSELFEMLSIN